MIRAALALLVGVAVTATAPDPGAHLLAGAKAFREGRYESALVEFRVAENLGSPDARAYAAATLVKLDRTDDALEAFGRDPVPEHDSLLDFYRALACYSARLYLSADRLLASVGGRAGPRIAEQAAKIRESIAPELAREPTRVDIDWYLERCAALASSQHPAAAFAYCTEAAEVAGRRGDAYRRADALARLEQLGAAAPARDGR